MRKGTLDQKMINKHCSLTSLNFTTFPLFVVIFFSMHFFFSLIVFCLTFVVI